MRRLLRPLAGLRRRSKLLELLLAALVGIATGAGVADESSVLPAGAGLLVGPGVALVLLHLRRRRPLVPFLLTVAVSAVALGASASLLVTAYALARYDDRWRVRAGCAVLGVVAGSQVWTGPRLDEGVALVATALFAVLLPGAAGAVVCARAQLMAALRERAERAEGERESMAREAVLTERTRIAREMHDAVGHRVSLMVLQAGAIEVAARDADRVEHLAGEVQRAGRQALDELRQMVGVLRDGAEHAPLAPQSGLPELPRLVADSRAAGMAVELTGPPVDAEPVDPGVGRAAYRIVQEALTNAGRHAPGATTSVVVERPPGRLVVRVVNGPPPAPSSGSPGGGYGLTGLGERVRTLHGTLRAEPRLDGGFVVEAEVPA
ncbi:sensor histidine kinase [Modestobacter sp. I12A-02628]|uniref:histidine kinase n=1 Tax=Goekera deserti TaxID=2497753 RepID=A0A7K3WJN3_9ACTN|nr:histidine kinase [Goekera deserti]MPQ99066.1 sensor histidine kinase [Goekera deserti]NDI47400.1 sensor histidine kinase [Goekera deserti]NEL55930.1 sensor histidine kinase [Goekera deserti]